MKKISVLLALMLAMCSFTACGDNNDSDEKETKSSESELIDDNDDDDDDDDDDDSKKSNKKDEDDDNGDDKKDDKESGGFVKGKVEDGVYTSDFTGLTCEIPDGWNVLSDEEIKATMNIGLTAGGSSFDADTIMNTTSYDLVASNTRSGESIMIIVEDISKYPNDFSIDDYIRAAKVSTAYTMPDMDIEWNADGEKKTLCGMEFEVFGMEVELENYGLSVSQEYHIAEKDGYMIIVTYSGNSNGEYADSYTDFFKD